MIDGHSNKVTGTLGVSSGDPTGITLNPFLTRLFTPLGNDQVDIFDVRKNILRATTTVGSASSFAAVNWVTGNVYVTDSLSGPSTVGVLDKNGVLVTTVPVGDTPYGVDVDPTTNRIFVASAALDNVTVIDGSKNTVLATFPNVPATLLAVNFSTHKVYVPGGIERDCA